MLHSKDARAEKEKKKYESKGKEMEFTVQTSGEFQCPPRHSRALFRPRVNRAVATAGYFSSDASLHTLEIPGKVYLFKGQQAPVKEAEAPIIILFFFF